MPYVEWRGNSIRVKWWAGEYLPSGKKKYESASGPERGVRFRSDTEAYDYGLDREHDVRHGTHIGRTNRSTPTDTYAWTWLDAQDLRPESVRMYTAIIKNWIAPYWKSQGVGDVTSLEYDAWKKSLTGHVSASYESSILSVFGMMMEDAVLAGFRADSPVVKRRRRGRYKKKPREKKRPLAVDTVYQLAVNAHTVWGYTGWTYIWTMAFTGMRTGEPGGCDVSSSLRTGPPQIPTRSVGRSPCRATRSCLHSGCSTNTSTSTAIPRSPAPSTSRIAPWSCRRSWLTCSAP
ncbi:hypothetical protein [Streptomyces reniochalinae]